MGLIYYFSALSGPAAYLKAGCVLVCAAAANSGEFTVDFSPPFSVYSID